MQPEYPTFKEKTMNMTYNLQDKGSVYAATNPSIQSW